MIQITNEEFLRAIFGEQYHRAHVTSFDDDPSHIEQDRRWVWAGHLYSTRELKGLNQYYTVSLFHESIDTISGEVRNRRTKASFDAMHIVCLDDVKEKLSYEEALKLPKPSFMIETSHGSEQWGYILETPSENANQIDNLLDGLVACDLAPKGTDPGMKGVTRYVRLPESYNNKKSKLVFGRPFKCRITAWNPELKYTLEQIAAPFAIDLNAERRETKIDGAADNDHPILKKVKINSKLGPGRYDIECPWIDNHTDRVNSGTAIFTNDDNSLGFKCHHGSCNGDRGSKKTALDVIRVLDLNDDINMWKIQDLLQKYEEPAHVVAEVEKPDVYALLDKMEFEKDSAVKNKIIGDILGAVNDVNAIERKDIHKRIRTIMDWSVGDLKDVLKEYKKPMDETEAKPFYSDYVFVAEQNKFFNNKKKLWHTPEAFTNVVYDKDKNARNLALEGLTEKVDKLDYYPEQEEFFNEGEWRFSNMWRAKEIPREPGDCSPWLNHFKLLGWDSEHILKWMAFTLRHPAQKINHGIILGSSEGSGKDWLLTPLKMALGEDHQTIEGEELVKDYNGYLVGKKYLHINEVELGDNKEALKISNKLKPVLANPPHTLRVRELYIAPYDVRNVVNVSMSTNSRMPLRLRETSRRLYCLWTDFQVKDERGMHKPEWIEYWNKNWRWMENGGWKKCVNYLMELDLAGFNPGAAPPVTEWLREMVYGSQNTIIQTLEGLIGAYYLQNPIATTKDILNSLAAAKVHSPGMIYHDKITPSNIELNMRNMGYTKQGENWLLDKTTLKIVK